MASCAKLRHNVKSPKREKDTVGRGGRIAGDWGRRDRPVPCQETRKTAMFREIHMPGADDRIARAGIVRPTAAMDAIARRGRSVGA